MTIDRNRLKGTWQDFVPVGAVLIVGTLLAIASFLAVRNYYASSEQQQFRRDATYYSTRFKDDVERHVTSLAAIRAFVSASRQVTRWEFSAFAHQIRPQNSGFKAVLWVPVVQKHDRAQYEKTLQEDGLYGLKIRQVTAQGKFVHAGAQPLYLPVSYVEPFEGNGSLVGLDLSANTLFAALFQTAGKTGQIAASAPVSRALITGLSGPVVLIAFPLRSEGEPRAVSAGAPPQGYALGILELDKIIADAIGTAPIQAAIAYSADAKSPAAMFAANGRGSPLAVDRWLGDAAFHQAVPFDIAGNHYLLALRSPAQGGLVTSLLVPLGACLLVVALTSLLMQTMLSTTLRKRMVENAVILRTAELNAANRTLLDEVEQRRQAEAALRVARDKAETANNAKSAFLATMSHELRTPLNAIIGFSGILASNTETLDPRSADYIGEIHTSGKRLLDLINDILEITQMDHEGALKGDEHIFLPDCIGAAIAKSQDAAAASGITLKSVVPDGLPFVCGDTKRLQKSVMHLLSNAIKFTPRGGAAEIAVQHGTGGTLTVQVSDNGVGMPPGADKKILELFSQFDNRRTRHHEGAGLGLAYVSRVAHLHEAELEISSTLGQGTCVRLTFPAHRIALKREVA
ncbi:MAG TPA: CHASE domain-containing protein [Rhizomicrobium sp.]|nr:CHASE domain-containing protein [Rhizomicrobium sp.]